MIPLNCKFRLLPGRFGLFGPLNQQAKKEVTVLAGGTRPDHPGESGLLFCSGGEDQHAWNSDPFGCVLVLFLFVTEVNGKL